jgi:hypothetical protein
LKKRNTITTAFLFRTGISFFLVVIGMAVQAQQVDFLSMKQKAQSILKNKSPIKLSGGISANSVFYNGNAGSSRAPFTYFLNGNLSVNIYDAVTIPLSFTLTNQGASYSYKFPSFPNRLSLHPKYKWITGHVGDVSMSFSPYTLSGMQFRGGGIDLAPKGKWKYSAMYGLLQRAVEFTGVSGSTQPAYKRWGKGAKVSYDNAAYKFGVSVFHAKDVFNSLQWKPDSLQIFPMENVAMSTEGSVPLMKNLVLTGDFGMSVLTRDIRAPQYNDSNKVNTLVRLLGGRLSTNIYKSMKAAISYTIGSSMIGAGFERVDPGYQTLGAYYFNNDLENITANFAQSLFKGKVNLSGNIGFQRDDLDKKKAGSSVRRVGAFNLSFAPSKRLTTSSSYSNFTTFTNVKPQFQYINQLTPFDNLDTLNFRQLSQNANININYIVSTSKERPQSLNLNFNFQDAFDEQSGIVTKGNSSQFFNFAGSYSYASVPKAFNVATAFNATYNTVGTNNTVMLGPTVSANKQLFDKRVRTGASVTYNTTINNKSNQNQVMSFRMNSAYVFKKKHNISLTGVGMINRIPGKPMRRDMTVTVAYNYSFSAQPFGKNKEGANKKKPSVPDAPPAP